jgi:hypothetical protein
MPTPTRCESCGLVFFAEDHPDACPRCKASRLAPPRPSSRPPTMASRPPEPSSPSSLRPLILGAIAVCVLGGIVFVGLRSVSFGSSGLDGLGLTDQEQARLEAVMAPLGERFEAHPRGRELVRRHGPNGLQKVLLELTSLGFRRLSDDDLVRWNQVRIRLAEASPTVCAGMWNGGVRDRDVVRGLLRLSDADLRLWFELTQRAVLAELDATTAAPDYAHVLVRGLRRIGSRLPAGRRQRFFATLGEPLGAEEACETTLLVLRGVDDLEPDIRIRFLRSLAGVLHDASAAGEGEAGQPEDGSQ